MKSPCSKCPRRDRCTDNCLTWEEWFKAEWRIIRSNADRIRGGVPVETEK